MKRQLEHVRFALSQVFAVRAYTALAAGLATLVFLLAVWFPNLGLIAQVYSTSDAPLAATLAIALKLLGGIGTNFSLLSAGYTFAVAVLFGVLAAMIAYVVRQSRLAAAGRSIALGSGGVASGVLGLGCAACGSLILNVVAPALAASGVLAALPLQGEEFGIASVALLLVSLVLVSKGIAHRIECQVAPGGVRNPEQIVPHP